MFCDLFIFAFVLNELIMARFTNLQIIRGIIVFFMVALVVSGATAFPIESELKLICSIFHIDGDSVAGMPAIFRFVYDIKEALIVTNQQYPQLAYGCDWLAFAHLVIAGMFVGPFIDPIRNKFVIYWGMFACVAILPLAFICGPIREMPFCWTLIDCSFGVFGIIPLIICMKYIKKLEAEQKEAAQEK